MPQAGSGRAARPSRDDRVRPGVRGAMVAALAGCAFAIGFVAAVETLSLALPGPRANLRTWGPIGTAVTMALVLAIGVPSALVVEITAAKLDRQRPLATLVGYLLAIAVWTMVLLGAWRAIVDVRATLGGLGAEITALLGGGLLVWAGARLAQRRPPGPAPVFAFSGVAIVGLAVITAVLLL